MSQVILMIQIQGWVLSFKGDILQVSTLWNMLRRELRKGGAHSRRRE